MINKHIKTGIVLDANSFNSNFIAKSGFTNFLKDLPEFKVMEIGELIVSMVNGDKLTAKPIAVTSQDGSYQYLPLDVVGKGGKVQFFIPYHPKLNELIFAYIRGKVKVAFTLDEVYEKEVTPV